MWTCQCCTTIISFVRTYHRLVAKVYV